MIWCPHMSCWLGVNMGRWCVNGVRQVTDLSYGSTCIICTMKYSKLTRNNMDTISKTHNIIPQTREPFPHFPCPVISLEHLHSDFHSIFKQINLRGTAVPKQGYWGGGNKLLERTRFSMWMRLTILFFGSLDPSASCRVYCISIRNRAIMVEYIAYMWWDFILGGVSGIWFCPYCFLKWTFWVWWL